MTFIYPLVLADSDLPDTVGVSHFRQLPLTVVISALFASSLSVFRTRAALQLEILALRHQLGVLQRSGKKPTLNRFDQCLWAWFCGTWAEWRSALCIVKPETVIAWHRKGFPAILDVESSSRPTRASTGVERHP